MRLSRTTVYALIALFVLATAATAEAVVPFAATATQGANPNTWIYTLINYGASAPITVTVVALELNWNKDWNYRLPHPALQITHSPDGWVAWGWAPEDASWPNWGAQRTNDPTGGHSLSGFEITMQGAYPPPSWFSINYVDTEANTTSFENTVSFPLPTTTAPEPVSLTGMLIGLTGLGLRIRKRRF
jgi:hypothetical protein